MINTSHGKSVGKYHMVIRIKREDNSFLLYVATFSKDFAFSFDWWEIKICFENSRLPMDYLWFYLPTGASCFSLVWRLYDPWFTHWVALPAKQLKRTDVNSYFSKITCQSVNPASNRGLTNSVTLVVKFSVKVQQFLIKSQGEWNLFKIGRAGTNAHLCALGSTTSETTHQFFLFSTYQYSKF